MLEIPEEALENLLAALTRMTIGFVFDGTVEAAHHFIRENRLEREREKLENLEETPTLWEWEEGEEDANRTSPGIPVVSPVEPLRAPPTGPIPLGGPLPPPAGIPQEEDHLPATTSTWKEIEAASGITSASAREPNSLLPSKHGWRGTPSPRRQQRTGGGWSRISWRSSATPPNGSTPKPRPAGREPWRRARRNRRKKRRPDTARRPCRN